MLRFGYGRPDVPAALPAMAKAYLDSLPDGLESYPEARVKNSVVRTWLEGHDAKRLSEALPPSLGRLGRAELPVNRWIPEVHAVVVYLSLRELFFPTDEAFVEDSRERNHKLLANPMYNILVRALSVQRVGKSTPLIYNHMHQGTRLEVDAAQWPWIWSLTSPDHLVPSLLARCYATAIGAAIELNGQDNVQVLLRSSTPTVQQFTVSFDR